MSTGWDNATLKKLKALTVKGLSTSEIGKRLGMSKNAIVGKLNRLGWNAKAGGAEKKAKETKVDTKKTTAAAKATKKAEKKVVAPKVEKSVKKETVKKSVKTSVKKITEDKKVSEKKSVAKVVAEKKLVKKETPKVAVAKEEAAVKSSAKSLAMHQRIIQHSLEMSNLKPNQCRWPIGDPDSEHFHFCGETVFVGKPYCYEHCKQAYQFAPPKKK